MADQALAGHGPRAAATGEVELASAAHGTGGASELSPRLADLLGSRERWSEWRATALHARRKLAGCRAASEFFSAALQV
ncbi:MAG: hypothetical protein ACJAQ3_004160 [Planctomycetota bacterium]